MPGYDLVVRLPNWIGDCVMAQPALQALCDCGLRVLAVGQGWAPTLFAGAGFAVQALHGERAQHARQLRALGARHCLLMTHSLSTAVVARRAGMLSLGFERDGRGPLLRERLRWPAGVHESKRYWLLAEATRRWLGVSAPALAKQPPWCTLTLPAGGDKQLDEAWQTAGLNAVDVLLCPVATGTVGGVSKHYPHFADVAAQLVDDGLKVAALAPPGQRAKVAAEFPHLPLLADLSFAGFLAALARPRSVLSNDSGPMHTAAALGTQAVVPFGVTSPARTGAWSPQLLPVQAEQGWPTAAETVAGVHHALERV